jgi:osmotically-inducible protein OsmY
MKTSYQRMLTAAAMVLLASSTPLLASETDERIESSFKGSYAFKTFLQDDAVKVASKEGVVTLSGTVNEESERGLAQETAANLPGVKSVDNRLELKAGYPLEKSNEWLAIDIKTALLFHRNVSMPDTQVYVEEGIVTLRGEAANEAQKELTAEYADIDGVREVKNEMTVAETPKTTDQTAQEKIDDASITAQVKMALLTHRATRALKIKVETKDGVVTLNGKTTNAAEKDLATKLVSDIHGVNSVVNNMTQG